MFETDKKMGLQDELIFDDGLAGLALMQAGDDEPEDEDELEEEEVEYDGDFDKEEIEDEDEEEDGDEEEEEELFDYLSQLI